MGGGIYLIQHDETLVELTETPYDSEDLLQRLLATYPSVLAGDQVDRAVPRRWVLVGREVGVPDAAGGGDRWSLDHLFLDQDAIPTLVEVKRRGDTRIRREVVGQLLDYAANAEAHWSLGALRERFEGGCRDRGLAPEPELLERLGLRPDAEGVTEADADGAQQDYEAAASAAYQQFWQAVQDHLAAGRMRLVFVADEIPPELRRIVEFLNKQMRPAEVLAVEIRQYVGQGLRTLVPRVIGHVETPNGDGHNGPPRRRWDEASFFAELERRRGAAAAAAGRAIAGWVQTEPWRVRYGRGAIDGPLYVRYGHGGQEDNVAWLDTAGRITFHLPALRQTAEFAADAARLELLGQLSQIPGTKIRVDPAVSYPVVDVALLDGEGAQDRLRSVLYWIGSKLGADPPPQSA